MPGGRFRRSLLARIALTFAMAVALTAVALSLAAYYVTKHTQDGSALDEALDQSRQNLTVADAMLAAEPTSDDYEALMTAFRIRGDFDTLLQTGTETYRSGLDVTTTPVTAELTAALAAGSIRYQMVRVDGEPTIVVGSQLRAGDLTVYFFFPQGERLAGLADLRNILIVAGALLAALGAVGGYFLARRLMRPVREASHAATQMSRGDLGIRLPGGSDEFGLLAHSFNQMAANLQTKVLDLEAGQARERRFVADVTHELRTPIAALVGEASLLKSRLEADPTACPPEVERLVELVTHDIARLRHLVDELLEVCRLDAQAAETVVEPVDLDSFVRRLGRRPWLVSDRCTCRSRRHPCLRSPLPTNACWSESVVNLIENALAHGAPPVLAESRVLEASLAGARGAASLGISDSGPGIPLHDLPHIFDRFYKADPSRASGKGSGLGLAIARENARLLGGDLTAANTRNGGARFVLTLPLAEV